MYGDSDVMRMRAQQLREQGADIALTADQLVAQTDSLEWFGRAADAMRERIRERATHLRDVAHHHESAADSLDRHRASVETLKESIDAHERRAAAWRDAEPPDERLAGFTPPPAGHKDWLSVELPGT